MIEEHGIFVHPFLEHHRGNTRLGEGLSLRESTAPVSASYSFSAEAGASALTAIFFVASKKPNKVSCIVVSTVLGLLPSPLYCRVERPVLVNIHAPPTLGPLLGVSLLRFPR